MHRWLLSLISLFLLAAPARAEPIRIIAYGDSLTAGYGLPADDAFPVRLQAALRAKGHDVEIINAGVSGDTASGGLARLDWTLAEPADGAILELGANDALRGIDPEETKKALDRIMAGFKARDMTVLIAGMAAPRNLGHAYVEAFDTIYPALAGKYGALIYPFFLDGVVGNAKLNQADGIHPTAEGVGIIVERMLPAVEELIARIKSRA